MPILSLSVYARNGACLYTKPYNINAHCNSPITSITDEQHKLIFGMIYSLKELTTALQPTSTGRAPEKINVIKTGSCQLHILETFSGLRFVVFTTMLYSQGVADLSNALKYIYEIWVDKVVRSPVYEPASFEGGGAGNFSVSMTLFEATVDGFLEKHPLMFP